MKIRNGFVSNSSSSSYILAYNKNSVMTDPAEIVKYIDNNFRNEIMFRSEMSEGEDIFYLDTHQKNYLLNHKKRFIKHNTGNTTITDYTADKDDQGNYPTIEVPYVTAITGVYSLFSDPYEYTDPEVDMSDIPEIEVSFEEALAYSKGKITDPDVAARVNQSSARDKIYYERLREARIKVREKVIEDTRQKILQQVKVNPEDIVIEQVDIDRNNCDSDGWNEAYFASKYFDLDESTYYEDSDDPDLENKKLEIGPCPKCGHTPCGTINTGVESCIFCPSCYVRTAYYPTPKHISLMENDWEEGNVVEMFDKEKQVLPQ